MNNYRYLVVGDTIKEGDEVNISGFDSKNEVWHQTTQVSWGIKVKTNSRTFRRPIKKDTT